MKSEAAPRPSGVATLDAEDYIRIWFGSSSPMVEMLLKMVLPGQIEGAREGPSVPMAWVGHGR